MRNALMTGVFVVLLGLTQALHGQSNTVGSGIAASISGTAGSRLELGDVFNELNFPLTIEAWVLPLEWSPFFSPVLASDNVGAGGHYYGFWFRFNVSGNLIFEIGDGSGAGYTDRRGMVTSTSVPLNEWTHIAVVATSVTDMSFYFNGVLQPADETDGAATNYSILHTSYPAYIGAQVTPTTEVNFEGVLDEVRLWDIERSEDEIRSRMCQKLNGTESGLIGNWRFDEDYAGAVVLDFSPTGADGELVGSVEKVTSGAPIGDTSVYTYMADYTGVSLMMESPLSDVFRLYKINNDPYGIHVYRIDTVPYLNEGLGDVPNFYFGVFAAEAAGEVRYALKYAYAFDNGVAAPANEVDAQLYRREDNAITPWLHMPAGLHIFTNHLFKKYVYGRGEFIFTIFAENRTEGSGLSNLVETGDAAELYAYPNPTYNVVLIGGLQPALPLYLLNSSGRLVNTFLADSETLEIQMQELASGHYLFVQVDKGRIRVARVIKE